jgi:hypothetical protein
VPVAGVADGDVVPPGAAVAAVAAEADIAGSLDDTPESGLSPHVHGASAPTAHAAVLRPPVEGAVHSAVLRPPVEGPVQSAASSPPARLVLGTVLPRVGEFLRVDRPVRARRLAVPRGALPLRIASLGVVVGGATEARLPHAPARHALRATLAAGGGPRRAPGCSTATRRGPRTRC